MQRFGRSITVLLLVCGLLWACPAFAKEPARPELTLKQALEMAIKNSDDLKAAEASSKKAWEVRDDIAEDVYFTPAGGGGPVAPNIESLDASLIQADLSYRIAQRDKKALQDNIELDVYSKYVSIYQAEENLRAAEQRVTRELSALQQVRAAERVGMAAVPAVIAAQAKYEAAVRDSNAARENVDKAYISLNKLTGLWPEDRPVLVDKIEFAPLQVDNVDTDAARAVDKSDNVWKLQQNIDIQKRDLDYLNKLYEAEKYDIDTAKSAVAAAEKNVVEQTRTMYQDILALENQYYAAREALQSADENLRVVKVQYDVGMATKNDLIAAEAAQSDTQNRLLALTYQHALLKANYCNLTGKEIIAS